MSKLNEVDCSFFHIYWMEKFLPHIVYMFTQQSTCIAICLMNIKYGMQQQRSRTKTSHHKR